MAMPHMTGDKLSIEILKIRKDMPIILCTGYSEIISEDKTCKIGISKYVQKPIPGSDLSALIREVLDKKNN
ncbi:MAG: response regulator, partial [Proteobacteria bacterium]|nr:response regulator [Pseudomonadota bacterium]